MRVLITGGAGFIGTRTSALLDSAGHQVRVLDCLDPQIHGESAAFPASLPDSVETIRGDVCNLSDCMSALQDVDAVLHLAARTGVGQSMYDVADYFETNVRGTATLIEAIVKSKVRLKRLVLASSRAVYGEGLFKCEQHGVFHPDVRRKIDLEAGKFGVSCPACRQPALAIPTDENCDARPLSAYALTKKHQEDVVQWASQVFDIPLVVLRYFNVYGAGQSLKNPYTGVVSIFYSLLKAGRSLSLYEGGLPIRDFVHVSDVARANMLALGDAAAVGGAFNIGSGDRQSIEDISRSLGKAMGVKPELEYKGEFRVGDIFACYANLDRSADGLKYAPNINLAQGMDVFARWASTEESADLYDKTVSELKAHGLFGRAGAVDSSAKS